jgi:hypothetical protein
MQFRFMVVNESIDLYGYVLLQGFPVQSYLVVSHIAFIIINLYPPT